MKLFGFREFLKVYPPVKLPRKLDPRLDSLVAAQREGETEVCLNDVIANYVEPAAQAFFYKKFGLGEPGAQDTVRAQDAADLCGDVRLTMVEQLQALETGGAGAAIGKLPQFVRQVIDNVWHDWLNERNPERASLSYRIRHLLEIDDSFAVTHEPGRIWWCGLAGGVANEATFSAEALTEQVKAHHPAFVREKLPELVTMTLAQAEGRITFSTLVGVVAKLLGVKGIEEVELSSRNQAAGYMKTEDDIFSRFTLQETWAEIKQLLPRQRAALLLNLRDESGRDALVLFLAAQVVTLPELVKVSGLTEQQCAEVWHRLPLSDREIGRILGLTEKQVSNLRKAARDRLRRRLQRKKQ